MFCTKCGAELEDGAKFCTNCGAQTVFAKAPPAPAPAAPEAAAPETPAAAPQANSWQQPQQPQANSWQQQQPQQWQQIQQQWQNRQQPQQQWQQPTRQQPQQWQQQPTRGGSHAQPKKKGKGGLIAAIAGVLVVVVGVGGFVWPGFFKGSKSGGGGGGGGPVSTILAEKFSTPEEYYQAVETNNAAELAGHVSSTYDTLFLSNANSEDISASGTVKIEAGDKLRELLRDLLGEQIDQLNPGDDLKWLKNASLTYDLSRKGDLGAFNAGLQLNGTDLAHVKAVIEIKDGVVYLSVPELSDKYLKTTLEELNLDQISLPSSLGIVSSALDKVSPEDAEKLDPVVDAMPDAKTVDKLINKYLTEAVDLIEDVEKKENETLTTEDVSAKYTALVSTITPETVVKIVEKLGPELKEDKDVKKAFVEIASAAGEDGEAKYQEFIDKIDELLNDTSKITEKTTDSNIVVTVYLDKSGDVHGRIIDAGSQKFELLMPETGGQFALTVRYTKEGEEQFLLTGSGTRKGDKLTGDLDLTVKGEYYAVLGLDGFDIEKVKDGYFVGAVNIKPTASLWDKVTEKAKDDDGESKLPESVRSLLDSLVIRLDMNTSKDKAAVTLTLSNGSDKLISISVDGAKSSAKKIATVDGVEPNEWAGEITLDQLEKVVANVEKAGVPTAYTDMIDAALDNAFD